MRKVISVLVYVLILSFFLTIADAQTRVPYLEAIEASRAEPIQPADIQREMVLLSAQSRITANWPAVYKQLGETALSIGRVDLAKKSFEKYLTFQKYNASVQMELISIELQGYQTSEGRREFLDGQLKRTDLLPEVVSDLYRQLAAIAWNNYESDRAKKYLQLAIKRDPMNLPARELQSEILTTDPQTGQAGELEGQAGILQARFMINPLDAQTAMELAILAGKAGLAEEMKSWLTQAEKLRQTYFIKTTPWPMEIQLQLAESYLAAKQAEQAMSILNEVIQSIYESRGKSQGVARIDGTNEIHARILIGLAAEELKDEKAIKEQLAWFDKFASSAEIEKNKTPEEYVLTSMWFSIYSPKKDPARGVKLAKLAGDGAMARLTLAAALAMSGEEIEATKLIKKIGVSANPLVVLTRAMLSYHRKDVQGARTILSDGLKVTPYGSLRDVLLRTAKEIGLDSPPPPVLTGIAAIYKQINNAYLKASDDSKRLIKLNLNVSGDLTRGQLVNLDISITNQSEIPLFVGSGSLVNPFIAIEITPISGNQRSLMHYVRISGRQIIDPNQTIHVNMILNEVTGLDSFIANRSSMITQLSIEASVIASLPGQLNTNLPIAKEKAVINLPRIDGRNAGVMSDYLRADVQRNAWETAMLAYWLLVSKPLDYEEPMMVKGILNQLKSSNPSETRAAFAWVLRATKPDGTIFNALANLLKDEDWLVRLMAIDTLGHLQGKSESAKSMFQYYAVKDCDPLVRQMAASYLMMK
jgi:Tfp pilus assembly protein PilF